MNGEYLKMVTFYTKNNCMQCKFAKMFLESKNVEFKEINVDEDPEALEFLRSEGYMAMPVVMREGYENAVTGNNVPALQQLITA